MFFNRPMRPTCMLVALTAVLAPHARAQQTISAHALVDTVGVNVHLDFGGTLYTQNFPLVLSSLGQLHIAHVRDGLSDWGTGASTYYTHHQQLAAAGIRADFITSVGQTEPLFLRYPAQVGDMEAIEAPNELDTQYNGDWVGALQNFLPGLRALSSTEAYRGITVIGPSLVDVNWWTPDNAYAQLGNVGQYFDLGNMHNYPSGRNPGNNGWSSNTYASISWAVSTAEAAWPGVGLVSTETGYRTDLPGSQSVPSSVAAKYIPRMVLEQYLHGVRRTYFYELADDPYSGGSFGLLTASGAPKPAFLTLKALMTELGASTALTPKSLPVTVAATDSNLHSLLAERSPGSYVLLLWLEEPCYDMNTAEMLTVAPATAFVTLPSGYRMTKAMRIAPTGTLVPVNTGSRLSVTDDVLMVEITGK